MIHGEVKVGVMEGAEGGLGAGSQVEEVVGQLLSHQPSLRENFWLWLYRDVGMRAIFAFAGFQRWEAGRWCQP